MHKTLTTTLSLAAGLALAVGVPLAASASPAASTSAVATHSVVAAHVTGKQNGHSDSGKPAAYGHGHQKPTTPAYPPTTPPTPPVQHHHPYWHGGCWWFPFVFPAHTFHPGATVHVYLTGFGGLSFFGTFQASSSGALSLGTAAADGSLNAQLRASGAQNLASQTLNATVTDNAGTSVSQTIAVPRAVTKAATTSSSTTSAASPSLAESGTFISVAAVWGAVGLVSLGGGFLAMRSITRRKRRVDL